MVFLTISTIFYGKITRVSSNGLELKYCKCAPLDSGFYGMELLQLAKGTEEEETACSIALQKIVPSSDSRSRTIAVGLKLQNFPSMQCPNVETLSHSSSGNWPGNVDDSNRFRVKANMILKEFVKKHQQRIKGTINCLFRFITHGFLGNVNVFTLAHLPT